MKRINWTHGAMLAAGALALTGCHPGGGGSKADTTKAAEAVKADVAKLVAEFNAHDAKAVVAHDADDEVSMFHGVPNTVGPMADLMMTTKQVADPLAKIDVSNEKIDVAASGEMAVYRADYAFTMTDSHTKKRVIERGNWIIGYKTGADGRWKVAWNVVSNTVPATEQ